MNDKKFIQLLNLYIDGEAAPAEAVQVEHEIENNPARRRIYRDYDRIQKATRTVYEQFRTGAGGTRPHVAQTGRAASAEGGSAPWFPFRQTGLWLGGAAAACMAVAVAYWALPQGSRSHGPQPAIETAGVSVPTIEAAAVVATADAPESSYRAPFAMQTRPDPYVRFSGQATDPFSLSPTARQSDFGDPALVLTNVPVIDSAAFAPAGWPVDPARVAEQNRKFQMLLRARSDASEQKQGGYVPVDFHQGP